MDILIRCVFKNDKTGDTITKSYTLQLFSTLFANKTLNPSGYTYIKQDLYTGVINEHYNDNLCENDICYIEDRQQICVVCYDTQSARFKLVPVSSYNVNSGLGSWTGYPINQNRFPKILGNVHENPTLLNYTEYYS